MVDGTERGRKLTRRGAIAVAINIALIAAVLFMLLSGQLLLGGVLLVTELIYAAVASRTSQFHRRAFLGLFRAIKVTQFGGTFCLFTIFLGAAAINSGANLLFLVFGMLMSALVGSGTLAVINMNRLRFERLHPPTAFAGEPFFVRLRILNDKRFFPSFSLAIDDFHSERHDRALGGAFALKVPPRGMAAVRYVARLPRRGAHQFDSLQVRTRFPFGLIEIASRVPVVTEMVALPRVGALLTSSQAYASRAIQEFQITSLWKGEEEDFLSLREFRPGDNPKYIHWRSSAKRRKLMVREFERKQERRVTILFDTFINPLLKEHAWRDGFEEAVEFVATVVHELAARGFDIQFAQMGPEFAAVRTGTERGALMRILSALAVAEPSRQAGALELIPRAREALELTGLVLLVHASHSQLGDPELHEAAGAVDLRRITADRESLDRMFRRLGSGEVPHTFRRFQQEPEPQVAQTAAGG